MDIDDQSFNCAICLLQYHQKKRRPMLICTNHHSVCEKCLERFGESFKCPLCQETTERNKASFNRTLVEFHEFHRMSKSKRKENEKLKAQINQIKQKNTQLNAQLKLKEPSPEMQKLKSKKYSNEFGKKAVRFQENQQESRKNPKKQSWRNQPIDLDSRAQENQIIDLNSIQSQVAQMRRQKKRIQSLLILEKEKHTSELEQIKIELRNAQKLNQIDRQAQAKSKTAFLILIVVLCGIFFIILRA